MKEHTYGWYPSAKNVYEERRMGAPTPYQIEALYRFRDSKYYQPPITPAEQRTPKPSSQASMQRSPSQRPASSTSHASKPSTITLRAKSVPLHTKYKPPPKLMLPKPQECWSTQTPEEEVRALPASLQVSRPVSLRKSATPQATPVWQPPTTEQPRDTTISPPPKTVTPKPTPPPSAPVTTPLAAPIVIPTAADQGVTKAPSTSGLSQKFARVQSAKVRRESATRPQRPVKSAGPVRASPGLQLAPGEVGIVHESPMPAHPDFNIAWPQPDTLAEEDMIDRTTPLAFTPIRPSAPTPPQSLRPASSQRTPSVRSGVPSPANKPPSSKKGPLRPKAPSPFKMEKMLEEDDIFRAETPDYETEARKHGWLMEVHGNPLNLKKVSRRLPYTVKVDEPETERDPPKVHMENIETFFLNTIPRRPMAFTIDKEWISEMIHAKRMELQKKHGINYRYKNFSFVY